MSNEQCLKAMPFLITSEAVVLTVTVVAMLGYETTGSFNGIFSTAPVPIPVFFNFSLLISFVFLFSFFTFLFSFI